MIRKFHNHKLQTTLWYCEEEPQNNRETPGRQTKQRNLFQLIFISFTCKSVFYNSGIYHFYTTKDPKYLTFRRVLTGNHLKFPHLCQQFSLFCLPLCKNEHFCDGRKISQITLRSIVCVNWSVRLYLI